MGTGPFVDCVTGVPINCKIIHEGSSMKISFENQTAIITGAASGLGLAIAKSLASYGVKLALLDKRGVLGIPRIRPRAGRRGMLGVFSSRPAPSERCGHRKRERSTPSD